MLTPALGSLPGPERLTPLQNKVAALVREGLYPREIARVLGTTSAAIDSEVQSVYTGLGITDLLTLAMYASMLFLVDFQFEYVAHSDVDIGLREERNVSALLEARRLPGVDYSEPVFAVSCDLSHGRRSRRLAVMGLSTHHRLTTPMRLRSFAHERMSGSELPPSHATRRELFKAPGMGCTRCQSTRLTIPRSSGNDHNRPVQTTEKRLLQNGKVHEIDVAIAVDVGYAAPVVRRVFALRGPR